MGKNLLIEVNRISVVNSLTRINHCFVPVGAPIGVVIGVPLGVLVLLSLVLLAAIFTVLALFRIRKRRRAFQFTRMAFTELDDEEDEK